MYKIVMVPLDGSKRAENILPYVEELVRAQEATVILAQVIEPPPNIATPYEMMPYYDPQLADQWAQEALEYLKGVAEDFGTKGIATKTVVERGPIVRTLLQIAQREGVQLIAMASHGHTGLARVFYGSVAAGILHQTDRPLLLVRADD